MGAEGAHNRIEVFNLSSDDKVSVKEIAKMVIMEMGWTGARYT